MNWDTYFINMLEVVRQKSKDISTKVGAIIVGKHNNILSTGYNGFPRGVLDNLTLIDRYSRPNKYLYTEHSERNALYNAARHGISLEGSRIYIDWYPCTDCTRGIIQSGLSEIIIDARDEDEKTKYWEERWGENMKISKIMLEEAGIIITKYKE